MKIGLPPNQISAVVLGIMQDAGLPHIGCQCVRCRQANCGKREREYAACLAIIDSRTQPPAVWWIDATPDIRHQLYLLADVLGAHPQRPDRLRQPDGIFLTHAHMGHTAGLAELGPEGMFVQDLPVYASPGLIETLQQTALWRPLLAHLNFIPLEADQTLNLAADLHLTPIAVPHRDELDTGTFGFHIQGPDRSLIYLPDIDSWTIWPEARERLSRVDIVLADATFYGRDEVNGRAIVAHPLIPETLDFFASLPCRLVLTHLNHTNPVLDKGSGERERVETAGAAVSYTGQLFSL
jgi:pyrroloquinoline quinone biosynthesis protein B